MKRILKNKDCYTLPKPQSLAKEEQFESQANGLEFEKEVQAMLDEIKSKIQPKIVCGKAINGNMLLNLALEYIQALQPAKPDLQAVVSSIDKVASVETERQQEIAFSNFEEFLTSHQIEYPSKTLSIELQKELLKNKASLRLRLSEFLPYSEVSEEADQFEERASQLMQSYLDENYSVGYQLSADILNKLCQPSDVSSGLGQRWTQILQDYQVADTENMHEVFAESCGSHPSNTFVDFSRVKPKEIAQSMADDDEDSIAQQDSKDILKAELPQVLDLLSAEVDKTQTQLSSQLNDVQYLTQLAHTDNENTEKSKIECQSEMDLLNTKIQTINLEKNDFTLELESIARQISEERQKLQDLTELKQMQERRQSGQQSQELQEFDETITKLQDRFESLGQQQLELDNEIQRESSQLHIEVKKYEGEIQALKDDIEAIEQRLSRSEKSVMFKTTQEFLQNEMPTKYIKQIKESLDSQKSSKDLKLELFQKHRDLNQLRMKLTEQESDARKDRDTQVSHLKSQLQAQLSALQKQHQDKMKQSQQALQQKLETENRLNDSMMEFVTQKETNFGLVESLENADMACEKSLAMIVDNRSKLVQKNEQMLQLEEDAYELTITNQSRVTVREKLSQLLPEMVKVVQKGQPAKRTVGFYGGSQQPSTPSGTDNLQKALRMIDDDMCRSKVAQILKKYKLVS